MHFNSEFNYSETGEVIIGTDKYNIKLNTPVLNLGTGFKTSLAPQMYMVTSIDFNLIPYDFLDVVHNFDVQGNRQKLFGMYAEFKIGIFYNFSSFKHKRGNSSGYSLTGYMPFAKL